MSLEPSRYDAFLVGMTIRAGMRVAHDFMGNWTQESGRADLIGHVFISFMDTGNIAWIEGGKRQKREWIRHGNGSNNTVGIFE